VERRCHPLARAGDSCPCSSCRPLHSICCEAIQHPKSAHPDPDCADDFGWRSRRPHHGSHSFRLAAGLSWGLPLQRGCRKPPRPRWRAACHILTLRPQRVCHRALHRVRPLGLRGLGAFCSRGLPLAACSRASGTSRCSARATLITNGRKRVSSLPPTCVVSRPHEAVALEPAGACTWS
jgi:hypothetical protein